LYLAIFVINGRPKWRAVAAMMRSGISGTASRDISPNVRLISTVIGMQTSAALDNSSAALSRSNALSGSLAFSTR
jgi:hypothetical protein